MNHDDRNDPLEAMIADLPWRANTRPPQLTRSKVYPLARIMPWLLGAAASFALIVGLHVSRGAPPDAPAVAEHNARTRNVQADTPRYALLVSADGRMRLYEIPTETHNHKATP